LKAAKKAARRACKKKPDTGGGLQDGKCHGTEDISEGTSESDSPCLDAETGFGPDFSCKNTEMWCGDDSGDGLVVGQCCPKKCKAECENKNKKKNAEGRRKAERERKQKRAANEESRKKAERERKKKRREDEWMAKRKARKEKNEKAEDERKSKRKWDENKRKKEKSWKQGLSERKAKADKRAAERKKKEKKMKTPTIPTKPKDIVTDGFQCRGQGNNGAVVMPSQAFPNVSVEEAVKKCSGLCKANPMCNLMTMNKYDNQCEFSMTNNKSDNILINKKYTCLHNPGAPFQFGKLMDNYFCMGGGGSVVTSVSADSKALAGKSQEEILKLCSDSCKENPLCDLMSFKNYRDYDPSCSAYEGQCSCAFTKLAVVTEATPSYLPEGNDNIQWSKGGPGSTEKNMCWSKKGLAFSWLP